MRMMMLYENMRLAFSSLKANKMRALLTMLGIIIGISSVIAIMTVGDSISSELTETLSGMGVNNIDVGVSVRPEFDESGEKLTAADVKWLSRDMILDFSKQYEDELRAVSISAQVGNGRVVDGNLSANVTISGESLGTFVIDKTELLRGRYFTEAETASASKVAIVSDKLVDNMFEGNLNDAIGQSISVEIGDKVEKYTVIGIYEYQDMLAGMGMPSGKNVRTNMYVPLQTAYNSIHKEDITNFRVMTVPNVDQDGFCEEIKDFFERKYYSDCRAVYIDAFSMASMVEEVSSMMDKITLGISVIAGIALLVGGIGVMNIMLVSITERTREIGTRKALGAPNSSIRLQFIIEAVVICIIGGLIGIVLGCSLGMLLASLMECPVSPSVRGIMISLSFSMAIGIFFGYYPANKAAKMDPIEALRYE